MNKTKEDITIHIPLTYLDSIWKGELERLPKNQTYQLTIDYPFHNPAIYPIKTGKTGMGWVKLLKEIGKAYFKTFEQDEKTGQHGNWGHCIEDLQLEGIMVNHKTKKIGLCMGS